MADVAALTGEQRYIDAIDRIWENIVGKKFYITGGVGATSSGEAFGKNYELPNMSAYCETCAAIAQVYLNYRLFLLHGDSKYYDALERSLYNGVISGISIDGGNFFYPNPLQSMGQHQRQAWFGCACCPSNAARFIPSLPQYIYAVKDNALYINLFNSNTVNVKVGKTPVTLTQQTNYPWNGDITLTIDNGAGHYALNIRIPGWVKGEVVPSNLYTYADGKYTMLDDHDKEVASVQVIDKENVKITILGTEYNRSVTVTKPSTEGQRAANHTWKVESFTLVYRSGTYNSTGSVDLNAIDDSFSKDLVMDKVIISDAVVVFPFKNEKVFAAQIPNGVDLSNFKMSQLTIQGTDEIPFFEGTASISFSWGKCVISIVGTYDGAPATAVLTLSL